MTPKGDPRESKFTMLLSADEAAMLQSLAEAEGLSAAAWLRRVIRERHSLARTEREGFGPAPKKARPKK